MDREFNLITEPWIKVMKPDKSIEEIGLRQALVNAEDYVCLAGETRSQDFAILRLLLALMYTIFSRYDTDGNEIDPTDDDYEPIEFWTEIWQTKKIPAAAIDKYFEKWHDRFWLFDDDHPFMQTNAVNEKSKPVSSAKLIGSLFESANKPRLFSDINSDGRKLGYSEAVRWLIHLNSFDDIAAKQPTPKKTWCSKLGLIALKGRTLFETIMLNYVADADTKSDVYVSTPSWEQEQCAEFNRLIPIPSDQAAILSLRSRSLYLCKDNGLVNGYYISGGDYFDEEDVTTEQMTIWRGYKEGKDTVTKFKPARHDRSKTAWQEFGAIAAFPVIGKTSSAESRTPGVIQWANYLKNQKVINTSQINIETAAVVYDLGQATSLPVIDAISDSLTFHSDLLTELGSSWRSKINDEIEKCEKAAKAVYSLSIDLQTSSGASGEKLSGSDAKMQFYDRIDRPFRLWLKSIEPSSGYINDKCKELDDKLFLIAKRFGEELADQSGNNAIFGRYTKPDKDRNQVTSSAVAMNYFVGKIKKIFNKGDENNGG
ncbi:MAG: type I-E CRISPR-associated protein Cse1/CasA [Ruminococcus sp.]|uniref:type I-E CRISPR-associated protein Cse1/CasA n=1 Tax=Ruminococcus sp. TaxID=41978 RepID=UPI0025EE15A6|nr:type I-E CRISPR-associated protein Cse1/CasA [Ruminococcus sp.]MBO4865832.1 type I-E CRISPR-associated protein Cse1/CasA [Ruminococcus sp.]